jgi:hypothetical protein
MWYIVAPGKAVHDTVIELDDMAVAVTPVGVAGVTRATVTTCEIGLNAVYTVGVNALFTVGVNAVLWQQLG